MDEQNPIQAVIPWLILIRAKGISPRRFNELLSEFCSPSNITNAETTELKRLGLNQDTIDSIVTPDWKLIEADLDWLTRSGNHFISMHDLSYPTLLGHITDPPLGLFVRGQVAALASTQIAIVGSRNPTPGGRRTATSFAEALGNNGITITSGLALGIDSAAHQGALNADARTIAVLGNGLDTVYPEKNRELLEKIIVKGAVVSEFPIYTKPLRGNFPRRNRIISGMATGTLIVEAALKSGSLITARFAMEQGREVFAIPGSIYNPLSRGCHELIRNGAKLTENIEHILEETGQLNTIVRQANQTSDCDGDENQGLDEYSKLLLDNIGYEPVTIDLLIEETGISTQLTVAALQNLELLNLIESLPGGSFIRKN